MNEDLQYLYGLNKSIEIFEEPITFLIDRFFAEIQDPEGDKITVDTKKHKRKLAPFCSHTVKGIPIAEGSYSTVALDPAYIRLTDAPSQVSNRKRRFGQHPDEDISPQAQLEFDTMDVYKQHEDSIQRRYEWMAANLLVTGSYLVDSPSFPTYLVDFQRNADNTITLGTAWSDHANADPMGDLNSMSEVVNDGCDETMTDVVMDNTSYNHFIKNETVLKLFTYYKGTKESELPDINARAFRTVSYKGQCGDYRIWVYNVSYDVDGTKTKMIPDGTVIGVAESGLEGFVAHGDIQNDKATEAGLARSTRFVDRWTESGVGKTQAQTETAPLVIPGNIDATASMNVL